MPLSMGFVTCISSLHTEGPFCPDCLLISAQPVDAGTPPRFALREDRVTKTTETWRTWAENREVEEWVQSVAGVLDQGWNEQYVVRYEYPSMQSDDVLTFTRAAAQRGARHYEFPTGYNYYFGAERYQVGEQYFTHSPQMQVSDYPNHKTSITERIHVFRPRTRVSRRRYLHSSHKH